MHEDQCSAAAPRFLFPLVAAICFLGRYSRSYVYVREQNIWSSTVSTATYGGLGCNSPIYLLLLVRLQPSARHCLSLAVGGCSSAPCERGL